VATISLAAGQRVGGKISYSIDVSDSTDFQVLTNYVVFSAVDKAGVLSSNITESVASSFAESAGGSTLADTWTILDGTNEIEIQLNANSSLTPTSMSVRFNLELYSATAIVTIP